MTRQWENLSMRKYGRKWQNMDTQICHQYLGRNTKFLLYRYLPRVRTFTIISICYGVFSISKSSNLTQSKRKLKEQINSANCKPSQKTQNYRVIILANFVITYLEQVLVKDLNQMWNCQTLLVQIKKSNL